MFDQHQFEAALDSAATSDFIDDACRGTEHETATPSEAIKVECADETTVQSTSADKLDIAKLRQCEGAADCDKFSNMSASLISVKQMDESNLGTLFLNRQGTVFDPTGVVIKIPPANVALKADLEPNGLHMTQLHDADDEQVQPATHDANDQGFTVNDCPHPQFKGLGCNPSEHAWHKANALTVKTVPALVNFCHLSLGAPPMQSWLAAIEKGWFTSWQVQQPPECASAAAVNRKRPAATCNFNAKVWIPPKQHQTASLFQATIAMKLTTRNLNQTTPRCSLPV